MSWMQSLVETLRETPFGVFTFGAGVAALIACAALVMVARRRRRPIAALRGSLAQTDGSKNPIRFAIRIEAAILVSLVIVPVMTVLGVEHSRSLMLGVFQARPDVKAFSLVAGVAGQLNAVALGSILMMLHLPLAALGLGFAWTYRHHAKDLNLAASAGRKDWKPNPSAPAVALISLGLAVVAIDPLLVSFVHWVTANITCFSAVAGVDPSQKAMILLLGFKEADEILDGAPVRSLAGLLVIAATACALAVSTARKARAATTPASPPSNRTFVISLVGCLVGAALCLLLAIPYYRENTQAIPVHPHANFSLSRDSKIQTPDIKGPDYLTSAPVLSMAMDQVTLEYGGIKSPKELAERLEQLKRQHRILHPDEEVFPGHLILHAHKDIAVKRLLPFLAVAAKGGYRRLQLAFQHVETMERPVMGVVQLDRSSAARVALELPSRRAVRKRGDGDKEWSLNPAEDTTYETLAAKAADARRRGMKVVLPISEDR